MARRHVLFVCHANWRRSPTAEKVFREMVTGAQCKVYDRDCRVDYDFKIASAGVDAFDDTTQMTKPLAEHYEEIFALDGVVAEILTEEYRVPKDRIINLDIPDVYPRDDPELIKILKRKLKPYVHKKTKIAR